MKKFLENIQSGSDIRHFFCSFRLLALKSRIYLHHEKNDHFKCGGGVDKINSHINRLLCYYLGYEHEYDHHPVNYEDDRYAYGHHKPEKHYAHKDYGYEPRHYPKESYGHVNEYGHAKEQHYGGYEKDPYAHKKHPYGYDKDPYVYDHHDHHGYDDHYNDHYDHHEPGHEGGYYPHKVNIY